MNPDRLRIALIGILLAASVALAGCTPGTGFPLPTATGTVDCLVERARADLAKTLGVDESAIRVVSTDPTQWSDASLGCPQPGVKYVQVVTPGCRVTLSVSGQAYVYHTGGSDVVRCEQATPAPTPGATVPATPTLDPAAAPLVALAKADLATRLGIPEDSITLRSATAAQWRDTSLGCPKTGTGYMDVITPGYLIMLVANGQAYEYHSGPQQQVVTCENPQPPLP